MSESLVPARTWLFGGSIHILCYFLRPSTVGSKLTNVHIFQLASYNPSTRVGWWDNLQETAIVRSMVSCRSYQPAHCKPQSDEVLRRSWSLRAIRSVNRSKRSFQMMAIGTLGMLGRSVELFNGDVAFKGSKPWIDETNLDESCDACNLKKMVGEDHVKHVLQAA